MSFIRSIRRTRLASAVAGGVARVKRSSPNREPLVPADEPGGNLAARPQGREILEVRGANLIENARRYYDGHRGMVHALGGGLLLLLVAGFAKRRRLI